MSGGTYAGEPEPFTGPHTPRVPKANEPGRLAVHGVLAPGWRCRWCKNALGVLWTPHTQGRVGSALICPTCDAPSPPRPSPRRNP